MEKGANDIRVKYNDVREEIRVFYPLATKEGTAIILYKILDSFFGRIALLGRNMD